MIKFLTLNVLGTIAGRCKNQTIVNRCKTRRLAKCITLFTLEVTYALKGSLREKPAIVAKQVNPIFKKTKREKGGNPGQGMESHTSSPTIGQQKRPCPPPCSLSKEAV